MNRIFACGFLAGLAVAAGAQTPDVFVRADIVPTYRTILHGDSTFRWYDVTGHHSTVGLQFRLEPGFRAFISERLQKIDNDADQEQLDEYYVEDPGIWRVGKQYLPFGRQNLLRDSARAARGDTRLLVNRLPIAVAAADNGSGRVRGVVARFGSVIGVSVAFGNNFGAQGTDLDLIRRPEEAPGVGRGYRTVVGLDFARHYKIYTLQAEAISLRRGQTAADPQREVSDLALTIQPSRFHAVTVGWSRDWRDASDFVRAQGKFLMTRNVWLEPIVRLRNGALFDAGITMRVKI